MRDRYLQFTQLTRLFAERFVENDLICVDGDTRATLIGVLSLLIAPGVFGPMMEYLQFGQWPLVAAAWQARDLIAIPHKLLHIALSMTVLGLFTVFEWDAMLPDRRDVAVLRPFPVGLPTLFAAKVTALFAFWGILTAAVDGISGVFFPIAVVQSAPGAVLLRVIAAHMTALVTANLFLFLAMIAAQGLLMTVLGPERYRRFAPYAQFLLIGGLLAMFFFSLGIAFGLRMNAPPPTILRWLPAYWFLGLDQVLAGWTQPLMRGLAAMVLPGVAVAFVTAAVSYALSYRRSVLGVFEAQDRPAGTPRPLARFIAHLWNEYVLRGPGERAAFAFVWQTVARSRSHRLLVAAWSAAGVALVVAGMTAAIAAGRPHWWRAISGPLLPVPIVVPLFLITGLRYAFTVPAELRGNWIFQQGCSPAADYLCGAGKAALTLALAPFAVLLPVYGFAWGWAAGTLHVAFGALVAWLLVEAQMAGLEKLPFTCSYVPGKANVRSWWTMYVAAYLIYVGVLSWLAAKLQEAPTRAVFVLLAAWWVRIAITRYRRAQSPTLLFDERPAPAVLTLELRG